MKGHSRGREKGELVDQAHASTRKVLKAFILKGMGSRK